MQPWTRRTAGILFGISLLVGLLVAMALDRRRAQHSPEFLPRGDVRSDDGYYSVVFYFTPRPTADTLATAKDLARRFLPEAAFTIDPQNPPAPPFIGFEEERAPLDKFPVPDASYFEYGHQLADEEIAALKGTVCATRLVLDTPKVEAWAQGRKFTELVEQFAIATGAYVWDSATRQCFSREKWRERRLSGWPEGTIPDLTKHITIHLYPPSEDSRYLRAITLGMEKFGLPDVVIERLVGSDNRPAGNLINLVCQSMAEHPFITDPRRELFRIDALKCEAMCQAMKSSLKKGATGQAELALLEGIAQEGDPKNRLVEIDFRHGSGESEDERRTDLLLKLWGATDSYTLASHTEEVLAASRRARARLGELRSSFEKGLAPGSRLMVKGPFGKDDGGKEWMWVEVLEWQAGGVEGILQNDPFYIKGLRAGSRVQVQESEIFDFILHKADGTSEGNETGDLIEKQAEAAQKKK